MFVALAMKRRTDMRVHDERGGHALYRVSCLAYFFNGFKIVKCNRCKAKYEWTLDAVTTCPGEKK